MERQREQERVSVRVLFPSLILLCAFLVNEMQRCGFKMFFFNSNEFEFRRLPSTQYSNFEYERCFFCCAVNNIYGFTFWIYADCVCARIVWAWVWLWFTYLFFEWKIFSIISYFYISSIFSSCFNDTTMLLLLNLSIKACIYYVYSTRVSTNFFSSLIKFH